MIWGVDRTKETAAIRAFADRYGLTCTGAGADVRAEGSIDGVGVSIAKVRRGTDASHWATKFSAFAPAPFPGGLVAYKPNFLWRLPGPRRISDDISVGGLLGFAHHDPVGDPELDRRLVIQADDVPAARAALTRDASKRAILAALEAVGHIRIQTNEVALERSDRVRGFMAPIESAQEVERLAAAAVAVVRALGAGSVS